MATYYIDYVTGSDSNAGTSTGAPFKHAPGDPRAGGSVPGTLSAGDTVVFKGGVTYSFDTPASDYIDITWSGTSGSPITYISGENSPYSWGTGKAIIDGTNADYTYLTQVCVIDFGGRAWIVIDGLKVINCYDGVSPINTGGAIGGSGNAGFHDNIIRNCEIIDSNTGGIFIQGQFGVPEASYPYNFTIHNNVINDTYGHNLMFRYGLMDFTITDNTLTAPGTGAGQADNIAFSYDSPGGGGSEQRRFTIRGNTMNGSEDKGHILFQEDTRDFLIEDNKFLGNVNVGSFLIAGPVYDMIVRNNLFNCTSTTFEGTIRFRTDQGNIADHDGIDIFNNTFVGDPQGGGIIYVHRGNDSGSTLVKNLDIRNNIFDTNANNEYLIWFDTDGASGTAVDEATLTIDYNVYYGGTSLTPFYYGASGALSFADWKTTTSQDANSSESNLTFENEAGGDFHLAAGDTAAIGSGVDLSATGFGDDLEGTTRTGAWDIGAYKLPGEDPGADNNPKTSGRNAALAFLF
jgi:hypothetical protein